MHGERRARAPACACVCVCVRVCVLLLLCRRRGDRGEIAGLGWALTRRALAEVAGRLVARSCARESLGTLGAQIPVRCGLSPRRRWAQAVGGVRVPEPVRVDRRESAPSRSRT